MINLAGVIVNSLKNILGCLISQKNAVSCFLNKQAGNKSFKMICKKCGCMLEYTPRFFREQIEEIIGDKVKRGYWKCPNCDFKKWRI